MARTVARRRPGRAAALPDRIVPQLTQLVDAAPVGDGWLHEIKYDGYRMMARLDHGDVRLLTRTGLDWTHKYPAIARRSRRSVRSRPISTASCAASAPTASRISASCRPPRMPEMRPRSPSISSICSTSTGRILSAAAPLFDADLDPHRPRQVRCFDITGLEFVENPTRGAGIAKLQSALIRVGEVVGKRPLCAVQIGENNRGNEHVVATVGLSLCDFGNVGVIVAGRWQLAAVATRARGSLPGLRRGGLCGLPGRAAPQFATGAPPTSRQLATAAHHRADLSGRNTFAGAGSDNYPACRAGRNIAGSPQPSAAPSWPPQSSGRSPPTFGYPARET